MSAVIQLGPAAIAVERLIAVALVLIFLAVASHRSFGETASRTAWLAVGAGILGARLTYVAQNFAAFEPDPLSALYLWQGGFSIAGGLAAAAAVLVVGQRGTGRLRSLALLAALGGLGIAAQLALAETQSRPFPAAAALTNLDGGQGQLPGRQGKPFVVNLWASWCPPCRREMPMLVAAATDSPVPILFVNQGEEAATVRSFAARMRLDPDAVLLDRAMALSEVGGGALPATIFVGGDGVIRSVHFGEISRAALLGGIAQLSEDQG